MKADSSHRLLGNLLSTFLVLYPVDGLLSILTKLTFHLPGASVLAELASWINLVFLLLGLLLYSVMGLLPALPKRYLLPLLLTQVFQSLVEIYLVLVHPAEVFQNPHFLLPFDLLLSVLQVVAGLAVIRWIRGEWSWSWPLFPDSKWDARAFSWRDLIVVHLGLLVGVLGLLGYSFCCLAAGVERISDGFVALHWNHLGLRSKTYVREDGKSVQLLAMMHIGNSNFYRQISQSINPTAVILLEGVSDRQHLLPIRLDYQRLAEVYHLSTQKQTFRPNPSQTRPADVDVADFSPTTQQFLRDVANLCASLDPEAALQLESSLKNPQLLESLENDLLINRNQHLLAETDLELQLVNHVALPWGVAHMPGLSKAILQQGFKLKETHEFPVLYFFNHPRAVQD